MVDGVLQRYTKGRVLPDEPDFETLPDDCRVVGYDVHALADEYTSHDAQQAAPQAAVSAPVTNSASNAPDQKEQRQDSRLQACIDAGLPMNTKAALSRLPDGVGDVADKLRLTRQAFSTDVKAALQRRETARRAGRA